MKRGCCNSDIILFSSALLFVNCSLFVFINVLTGEVSADGLFLLKYLAIATLFSYAVSFADLSSSIFSFADASSFYRSERAIFFSTMAIDSSFCDMSSLTLLVK